MQLVANTTVFFVFFMIPFLGGNHLPLHFITLDRFWIEGVFALFLVAAISISFLRNKTLPDGLFRFALFVTPFLIVSVASLTYSWNLFSTILWLSVLAWAMGCAYLYAISANKDLCLVGLVAGAAAVSLCAIEQLTFLFPSLLKTFTSGLNAQLLREQSGIPFASYMYHNILGGYLVFILPLALYFGLYRKSVLSMVSAVIMGVGIVVTSTRIGLGILIMVYLVTFAIVLYRRRKSNLLKLTVVAMFTVIAVLGILHEGGKKQEIPGARAIIVQKAKAVSTDLSTLNTRTDIWKNALAAYKHAPVVGFGAGAFEYPYRKYFDGNSYTGVAHSTIIKIAVEMGLIGLACFLSYLFGVGMSVRKGLSDPRNVFIFLALLAGILFSLVDFSFDVKSHVITFFVLSSAVFLSTSEKQTLKISSRGQGPVTGAFLLVALLVLTNFFLSVRFNSFKTSVESGDRLMEMGLPVNALYQYRGAVDVLPLTAEGYTRALSALRSIYPGETDETTKQAMKREIVEYVTALEKWRDKDSEMFFVLGQSHALLQNQTEVDRYFRLALEYYPSSGYYVHEIASHYASGGNYERAMEVIRSFDPFIEKHRGPHNPRGIYVYRIRDLESDLHYRRRNIEQAYGIAKVNNQDARNDVYLMTSARARDSLRVDQFRIYLAQKVNRFCTELYGRGGGVCSE